MDTATVEIEDKPLTPKIEYKTLQLKNPNNVLATDCFLYLGKVPEWPATLPGRNTRYLVPHDGRQLTLQLVDVYEWKFSAITNLITLPAVALDADTWRELWLNNYPETKDDTVIGIYVYQKINQ